VRIRDRFRRSVRAKRIDHRDNHASWTRGRRPPLQYSFVRFNADDNGVVSLGWLQFDQADDFNHLNHMLVEGVTPNSKYTVDATFQHESVASCSGTVDISVNGQTVARGLSVVYSQLSSIQLYNYSRGTSRIGDIDFWHEKAAPNQVFYDPWDYFLS